MTGEEPEQAIDRNGEGLEAPGWLLGLVAMFVAFNLRPALTSIGPLLTAISAEAGLSVTAASVLTTLPVICLGIGSAFGPATIARLGINRGILAGIALVTVGLGLRGLGEDVSLFGGTILAGLGIGLAGVLLPALVKRDFAHGAGHMTGLYTMTLCIGAALGTGLSVPLMTGLGGWVPALAVWALPALLAALAWVPFARGDRARGRSGATARSSLRGDPLAWQVTGFMGLQSSLAYMQFGWLPAVLEARDLSALDAGYVAALVTLVQAPGALVVATLAGRGRDQRGWVVGVILTTLAAFLVTGFGPPSLMIPAGIVLGFGLGGCLGLGLTLIVLRGRDATTTGALSAMAQGIGYSIASLGPLGFGLAHDASGGWALSAALFSCFGLAALACGLGAGRDRHVGPDAPAGDSKAAAV